jgi:hypothetical protein
MSGGEEIFDASTSKPKQGNLDMCIKRTANMDLSSSERVNENSIWLAKEIRTVRKKLKQIAYLLESEAKSVVLSTEQQAKVHRRPALEAELQVYELAMEEVKKKIKELAEEYQSKDLKAAANSANDLNQTPRKESTSKVSFSDEKTDKETEKSTKMECPESKTGATFHCELCGVRCSDRSSLLLHQNGRRHKNMAARAAEEEEKKVAASILDEQRRARLKDPPVAVTPPAKVAVKNAWGTPSSQPKFKLPPPPHPVVSHVTPEATKQMKQPSTDKLQESNSPASNFQQMLNNSSKKSLLKSSQGNVGCAIWDTTPGSTRCVPLSVYGVSSSQPMAGSLNDAQRGALSLGDFLAPKTPAKPSPSKKSPPTAPWLTPQGSTMPNSKSILQIQTEEAKLKECGDKSLGSGTSSWFVQRRECAGSLLEIQKGAEKELEERLLVEEQFQIEAQILEEKQQRQEDEKKAQRKPPQKKGTRQNKGKPKKEEDDKQSSSSSKSKPKPRGNKANANKRPNGNNLVTKTNQTGQSQTA